MELSPLEFVDLAADAGCDKVCLFANWPPGLPAELPTVPRRLGRELTARLADRGLGVAGCDFFPVIAGLDVATYEGSVAFAAELGARHLITAVWDEDPASGVAGLGALSELAAAHGLKVGIEFMGMTPACARLEQAIWYVDQVGREDLGIDVDVLHLVRSGGSASDVARLAPRYFNNAQICDGHGLAVTADYMQEAGADRATPGKGDFPLREVFAAVPMETPIDLELPSMSRGGADVRDFVLDAVARTRAILDAAGGR
jgi:sugar phosphate isomerase/epimerase